MTGTTIARLLETVAKNVIAAGFDIVGSVCDSASKNESAIKTLMRNCEKTWIETNSRPENSFVNDITQSFDTCGKFHVDIYSYNLIYNKKYFLNLDSNITRTRVIHLFDVPHLQKSIRNNLVTKDLKFKMICNTRTQISTFFFLQRRECTDVKV